MYRISTNNVYRQTDQLFSDQDITDLSLAHPFAHSLIPPFSILLPFRSKCLRTNDQDPAL